MRQLFRAILPVLILSILLSILSGCSYNKTNQVIGGNLNIEGELSSNLPIVIVDTGGKGIGQRELVPAHMKIINNGYGRRNSVTDIPEFESRIGIKVRGQTSANFPKKQYKLETWDEEDQDKDVSILGLAKESDWILYGPYADKSLIRNYLVFELGRKIMYAPETRFVEAYLDTKGTGEITEKNYIGLYLIVENIKRGKNRVDIKKLVPQDNQEPDITGGYIIARDKIKAGDVYFTTKSREKLTCVYPRGDVITAEQKDWIKHYIDEFEEALYGNDFMDPEMGYVKFVDTDSFIDCILINEYFKNIDGFVFSTYFYKDRGGKLTAGPLWDFNLSAGNVDYNTGFNPQGWYTTKMKWNDRLIKDPAFTERLADRWKELRQYIFSTDNVNAIIDHAVELLGEAQVRNFKRWDVYSGKYIWPNPKPYTRSYEQEIKRMKDFLGKRASWMDENIAKLKG